MYCPVCWDCARPWAGRWKQLWDSHVVFFHGNAVADGVAAAVQKSIKNEDGDAVLVTLDGSHRYDATLLEIKHYAPLVTVGSYLVVQDAQKIEAVYGAAGPYT